MSASWSPRSTSEVGCYSHRLRTPRSLIADLPRPVWTTPALRFWRRHGQQALKPHILQSSGHATKAVDYHPARPGRSKNQGELMRNRKTGRWFTRRTADPISLVITEPGLIEVCQGGPEHATIKVDARCPVVNEGELGSSTFSPGQVSPAGPLGLGQRWTVTRKREVALRLLRGEPVELLSRQLGVEIFRLEQWREKAIAGIDASLKERKGDPVKAELDRHEADRGVDHAGGTAGGQDGDVRPFGAAEVAAMSAATSPGRVWPTASSGSVRPGVLPVPRSTP